MTYTTHLSWKESSFGLRIMVIAILVLGVIVMQPMPGQAQWTNGTNINNTNTGNVGVGTANPISKLQVNKTVRIDDDSASPTGSDTLAASPMLYLGTTTGGNAFQFNSGGGLDLWQYNSGWGRTVTFAKTGKVGIGLTSPLYSLDVNGGVNGFRAKAATTSSSDAIAVFENTSGIQAIVRGNGNVGIGTTNPGAKLEVLGNITVTGSGNITASGEITGGTIKAKYQDVAEWVQSSQALAAGTVVVLDDRRSNQVIASSQAYDTRVAGVISLQPGIALGESGAGKVLVATTGRVKIKVDGPIRIGDLLVTSDKEGVAKKSEPLSLGGVAIHRPGTLIGKALEPLAKGQGEILVLLSLQ